MNHVIAIQVKKTFKSIFEGLAKELGKEVKQVMIGVEYRNGKSIYYAYVDGKKHIDMVDFGENEGIKPVEKIIEVEDFTSVFDLGVGLAKISIAEKAIGLAGEDCFRCPIEEIDIIIAPNLVMVEDKVIHELPKVMARKRDGDTMRRVRQINIEEEFA